MPRTTEESPAPAVIRPPRRATLWAAVVYAVATLSLAYPALAGQFLVNPRSDQYIAGYAFREFAASTLRATGGFPQWNPYLFGGMPYIAAMHGDIFYPTFLLRMILPTDVAMTWGMIIHFFLAGLFTYLFLRALGLGFYAALIGGLGYMMSGNIAGLVSPGHDGKLFISALLPVALLLVLRIMRDGRRWAYGAMAFVIGLAILTPHPQLLQYLLLASGAFALFAAFTDLGGGRLPRNVALRRLALTGGAVMLGLLVGAIQFLPVREYVPWSPRAPGHPWEVATSYSLPLEEIINFYLPQFSGMFDRLHGYWGRNGIHFHSDYLGVAVLILASLGLSRAWKGAERRLVWFWATTLVIALLWALGGSTPFFRLIYAVVPGTKFFRAPSTMLYLVSFSAAVLVAFGVERALRLAVTRRFLIGWAVVGGVVLVLAMTGAFTSVATGLVAGNAAEPYLPDIVQSNAGAVRLGALRSTVFALFTLACLFLLATRRLSPSTSAALLAATVGIDLWSIERSYWLFSPPAAVTFAADPTIEYLRKETEPTRVIPLDLDRSNTRDPFMWGDALMIHRIRQPTGYHGNELGRYQRLGQYERGYASIANPNFWSLMNVRFIIADTANLADVGVVGSKMVVGPVKNAAGSTVYLHRLAEDNPAAWVTPVIVKAGDDAVLQAVLDPRFDVRRYALFDSAAAVKGQAVESPPAPLSIRASVPRFDPGAIDVRLDSPAPAGSALVVSENYYPGWTATVDGKPATIGRADMTLIGVELPAGAREISLRFDSPTYKTGKTVTLAALLLVALAWAAGAVLDRRARA